MNFVLLIKSLYIHKKTKQNTNKTKIQINNKQFCWITFEKNNQRSKVVFFLNFRYTIYSFQESV